jgi:ABC-type transport system involved in resistance to organic solvents, periplasmic component
MIGISKGRIIAVAGVALIAATGATAGMGGPSGGRVIMTEFADVSPIIAGQQVKVHGVTVGEVGEPNFLPDRKIALVPLYVDAAALPIHSDATARVAPVSLLGERFVNLDQGTASAPEPRP